MVRISAENSFEFEKLFNHLEGYCTNAISGDEIRKFELGYSLALVKKEYLNKNLKRIKAGIFYMPELNNCDNSNERSFFYTKKLDVDITRKRSDSFLNFALKPYVKKVFRDKFETTFSNFIESEDSEKNPVFFDSSLVYLPHSYMDIFSEIKGIGSRLAMSLEMSLDEISKKEVTLTGSCIKIIQNF